MIKIAVIVAAGLGSRLREKTALKPKGFLEVEGISLIQRSIDKLLASGITKIYIGTGYLNEIYDDFAGHYPEIETVKSTKFETTNSMYTLYNMRGHIEDDFLLLESDLLYEKNCLKKLLENPLEDVILASGITGSSNEVHIETDDEKNLIGMSKNSDDLARLDGELVGISKISLSRYHMMNSCFEKVREAEPKIEYEYIMVQTAAEKPFIVDTISDLAWCKIDDAKHLVRAKDQIFPLIKARDTMAIKRNILLNPGPATTTDTVKMAQVVPDMCPREHEFGDVMQFVSEELTTIVANAENYSTILFGGSGTAVMDSVLSSVVPHDKSVLVINNGAYGQRMCDIARAYDISLIEFNSSSIEPIELVKLEKTITQNADISHLVLIHNETTTGLLNNLDDIGSLARKHGLEFIVDAMSSFAALPIDMVDQKITYLIASSNKNIQGMAGVGFVIAENHALEKTKDIKARNYYLNLYAQLSAFKNTHQMRFTPPVQTLYALKQAISEAKAEGIENRYARYSASWKLLTDSLKVNGLKYLVDDQYHSKIITSIELPDGVSFDHLHDYFFELGYVIYPGKVENYNTFRIANIGEIDQSDMKNFVKLLLDYLNKY